MADQREVLRRIAGFISEREVAAVADLRRLYLADPDALFLLATCGVPDDAPMGARNLEWLSRTTSVLVRDGFSIESAANQKYARGHEGGILALDDGRDDEAFLQELYSGSAYDSKFAAKPRSKACLDFFLETHDWDVSVRSTLMLRVAPEDATAITGGLPKYQYKALLDCAREVVRRPAKVYKGLRHDGTMKSEGMAFCGVPSRRWMNDGSSRDPADGFAFVVFVSPLGFVFDWDWVPASHENPALPRDIDDRFHEGTTLNVCGELLLGNIRGRTPAPFQPQHAWFSRQGDCVFWYYDEVEAYAGREDEYLTAFYQTEASGAKNKCVGFKLKMVSRLYDTIQRWAKGPEEGIQISVDTDAVKVNLAFLMKAWVEANLPRSSELFPGMRLVEKLGSDAVQALQNRTASFDIPRDALELQEF